MDTKKRLLASKEYNPILAHQKLLQVIQIAISGNFVLFGLGPGIFNWQAQLVTIMNPPKRPLTFASWDCHRIR